MKLINLTPHAVNIYNKDGKVITFPKCDNPARVGTVKNSLGTVDGNIELFSTIYTDIENLPNERDGIIYIVSRIVLQASPRGDLFCPSGLVRDNDGRIIGCNGLER